MSEKKEKAPKTRAEFLRDAYENQWLATDEGKVATLFDDTSLSPWGERGRS